MERSLSSIAKETDTLQLARARNLQAAYRRAEQGMDRSQARNADEVRGLGLIKPGKDEKGIPDAPVLPSLAK